MTDNLIARTRHLDHDVDLLAVAGAEGVLFERSRAGLAGRGVAARISWPAGDAAAAAIETAAALAGIVTDDEVGQPGCGAVAFGVLPFVPGAASELIVPELVVGRSEDGTRWVTTIGPADRPAPTRAELTPEAAAGPPQPQRFTVESTLAPEAWCDLVARATKELVNPPMDAPLTSATHEFVKVVLAREIVVTADTPLDRVAVLDRLRTSYPGCHLVSVDGLVGASPELLVARSGDMVRSHPMAGTAPRGGDPTTDQRLAASLLASTKDREEHQITIDMVHDTLLSWCSYLDYEAVPSVVAVANVQHLATLVEGRLSRPAPSVLELVAALHPTPAVAGWPRDRAIDWIVEHEGFERGRYAGTVGWADGQGNGTWAVALRCAELAGPTARVVAGNGIVADSNPTEELAETRAKLQALLSVIVRP
ncbi:MAG TPA: isochorismate synthase [Acidimicrobiales bacterium]|jgi:menaquinone-specific isochorismate synthase